MDPFFEIVVEKHEHGWNKMSINACHRHPTPHTGASFSFSRCKALFHIPFRHAELWMLRVCQDEGKGGEEQVTLALSRIPIVLSRSWKLDSVQ